MYTALCDTHTHSIFSFDGAPDSTVDALCERAIELGLSDLAITDHCDVNGEVEELYRIYDHEAAWNEMSAAKEKYKGKLHLSRGLELGQPHQCPAYTKEVLSRHPYEFVIGSLHNLTAVPDFCMMDFSKVPIPLAAQLFDRTLEEILLLLDYPVTTLGHLTYQNRYMSIAGMKFDFTSHTDRIAAIFEKLIRRDIALEINVSTLWCGYGFTMPHTELLRLYHDLGGRLVTLGSDAHAPENLARGIGDGAELLAGIGFTHAMVMRDGERVFLPLDH